MAAAATTTTWRDMTIPYTEEELAKFSKEFKSLSSFLAGKNGGSISAEQVPEMLNLARLERTAEQKEAYKNYIATNFEGRLELNLLLNNLKNIHKTESLFRSAIEQLDKDGDGFISEDEFDGLLKLLGVHDPALQNFQLTFECFVKEADTNKDGKVSLDECTKWFKNKINPEF